jgi:hypothetical protein
MSPTPPGLLDTLDEWTQSPWAPFYLWFGTNVLHVAVYWGMALPLAYFDLKITPSIITPYKVCNTRRHVWFGYQCETDVVSQLSSLSLHHGHNTF